MKRIPCTLIATALCGAAMAMSAASALAQSPSIDGYDETGLSTVPPVEGRPDAPSSKPRSSSPAARRSTLGSEELPFTGFRLPLLALVGGALVAGGVLAGRRLRSQIP